MITEARLLALKAAEQRQRRETINLNKELPPYEQLEVEVVDVEIILKELDGYCGCGCDQKLDFTSKWKGPQQTPLYPIIAHVFSRKQGGGHTQKNVSIWCAECNINPDEEKTEIATFNRFKVNKDRKKPKSKWNGGRKIQNAGFQKVKTKWPSRKLQSRKFK